MPFDAIGKFVSSPIPSENTNSHVHVHIFICLYIYDSALDVTAGANCFQTARNSRCTNTGMRSLVSTKRPEFYSVRNHNAGIAIVAVFPGARKRIVPLCSYSSPLGIILDHDNCQPYDLKLKSFRSRRP